MQKPQLQFEHLPTNMESGPFKPLLLSKPHALVPLETQAVATDEPSQSQYAAHIIMYSPFGLDHKHMLPTIKQSKRSQVHSNFSFRHPHPYQLEIEQYRYPSSVYTRSDPILHYPFDSTTATFVDSEGLLDEMLQELKQAKEIAIDLEHHDQRSYIGIVCLMQISTRDRDWIVDTLKPWRRKLERLNEVFADPSIVKVLHGAYMDIVWLQRDLGLYVVGLFDTHYAARALGYPGGSLAFLLKKFVDVDAQKQYQMADWRVRPLPRELFDYARSDTHYLLYIFDCMRNELIQRSDMMLPGHANDKLWDVLQKSSETALQRYEQPVYDTELGQGPMGWYKMLSRTPALLSKEQFAVFKATHKWRDEVAREQDDSIHYVMPNHHVFSIARELPMNRAAVLRIAQPTTQSVRLRVDELVSVIVKAKENGNNGPEMMDVLNRVEPHNSRDLVVKEKPNFGVAAFVPKPQPVVDSKPSSTLPIRSATSSFWGSAFESSAHQAYQRRELSTIPDVTLAVPMPPLTAEIFADPAEFATSTPVQPKSQRSIQEESEPTPTQDQNDDDVFVLKELGRKRKRVSDHQTSHIDRMAAQNDEVAIPDEDEEEERLRGKVERKKAKKDAKRAAKQAEVNGAAPLDGGEENEPFDYVSAPSILNPPREDREGWRERKKKEVNPYAKALDTPKGLPRAQKERGGRSMTYR